MSSGPGERLNKQDESKEPSHEDMLRDIARRVYEITAAVSELSAAVGKQIKGIDPFTHDQRYAVRGLGLALDLARGHADNLIEDLPHISQPE